MINVIYFATLPNGYFGSAGASWKSLSTDKISHGLRKSGYPVKVISISDIDKTDFYSDDILIYTSSDDHDVRNYIKDYIFLASRFCAVIPSYSALMAHENKGFQQIFRSKYGIGNLRGTYFFAFDQLPSKLPFVYKTVCGAGSSGVELISNNKDLKRLSKRFNSSLKRKILFFIRWLKLDRKSFEIYKYRYKQKQLSVSQEFIPGLSGDYKVLVFGVRLFVLRRDVKKGSFKASGSGKFSFPLAEDLPVGLLDFAKDVYLEMDVPYISLDIVMSNRGFHLIEYQVMNFGPYTVVNSPRYFEMENSAWKTRNVKSNLEECFSEALLIYVERKYS